MKHLCQSLLFNKVADLRSATLLEKRLWHMCFPMNFAKFLRTPFLIEHLLLNKLTSIFPEIIQKSYGVLVILGEIEVKVINSLDMRSQILRKPLILEAAPAGNYIFKVNKKH